MKKTRRHQRWHKVSSNSFRRVHDIPVFKISFRTESRFFHITEYWLQGSIRLHKSRKEDIYFVCPACHYVDYGGHILSQLINKSLSIHKLVISLSVFTSACKFGVTLNHANLFDTLTLYIATIHLNIIFSI